MIPIDIDKGTSYRPISLLSVVVVVCPLQPSSSVNSGCPGPESSILVSSRWACPISSQVTDHWGELRNRTDEVHPVDPFHSLDILKNHSASVAFCRNLGVSVIADTGEESSSLHNCKHTKHTHVTRL